MKTFGPVLACLLAVLATGCVDTPPPAKPGHPKAIVEKRSSRFECTFNSGETKIYRSYVIAGHQLVDQGPPRQRLQITADDGETVRAERVDRTGNAITAIEIKLRQHEASLTQTASAGAAPKSVDGTCAQTNGPPG